MQQLTTPKWPGLKTLCCLTAWLHPLQGLSAVAGLVPGPEPSRAVCVSVSVDERMAHLRLGLEDGGEEVAVPVLVLAPVLKVLEQGVQLVVGVALQVAVDADVPPVADLHSSFTVSNTFSGKSACIPKLW